MPIKQDNECDGCSNKPADGDVIYCEDCYTKLEKEIEDLNEQIKEKDTEIERLTSELERKDD